MYMLSRAKKRRSMSGSSQKRERNGSGSGVVAEITLKWSRKTAVPAPLTCSATAYTYRRRCSMQ